MGIIQIKHKATGYLFSDICEVWSGWRSDFIQPRTMTVAGVSVLTQQAVEEFSGDVTFLFANHYPTSTIAKMYLLWDAINRVDTLSFTDLTGTTYDANGWFGEEGTERSRRKEDIKHRSIYECRFTVIRKGFRIPPAIFVPPA